MINTSGCSEHYERVAEFHRGFDCPIRTTPTLPGEDERLLRAKLILEECLETVEALGFAVRMELDGHEATVEIDTVMLDPCLEPNLVEIADGCADIMVVTTGTLVQVGIPDIGLLKLVDENNLAKFGPGGHRRDDGKWIKPPGHQPPDIAGFLRKCGWEG